MRDPETILPGPAGPTAWNGPTRDDAGFTILELVISTFLMLIVMMLATQLLLESRRLYGRAAVAQLETAPEFAFTLLRRDLQAARSIAPIDAQRSNQAFSVTHADASVVWLVIPEEERTCLTRVVFDRDGEEVGRRCLLGDADMLVWVALSPALTAVTVTRRVKTSPQATRMIDDPRFAPDGEKILTRTVTAAHRGSLRGRKW